MKKVLACLFTDLHISDLNCQTCVDFIEKMCSGILVQNSGDRELGIEPNDYFITAVKINPGFEMWKTSKKWVFIWLDRVSEISLKGNNRIKYMHKFYSYFLIDKDVKIEVEPSKNRFDFGIHRVQKSLNEHKAVKYLEVQIQDFTGVQDSTGVLEPMKTNKEKEE